MDLRCFSLEHLRKFQKNILIKECDATIIDQRYKNYGCVVDEVTKCLEKFKQYEIEHHEGIAVDIVEHSAGSCVLLLGILNYGCHFYCLDFTRSQDLAGHLERSGVVYAVANLTSHVKDVCHNTVGNLNIFNKEYIIIKLSLPKPLLLCKGLNLCYTITTSGSTGCPKVVHVPYECIEPNIKSLCSKLNITEDDVIFLGSAPTFDPFIVELFMTLEAGATLLIPSNVLRLAPETNVLQEVTILQTTPSLFRMYGLDIIRNILGPDSILRCLLLGGEKFPSGIEIQSWLSNDIQMDSKRIFNIYGITEISCWSTIYEYDPTKLHDCDRIPLGKALDEFTLLQIRNDFNGNLPTGSCCRGELMIGSSVRRCLIPDYDKDAKTWAVDGVVYRRSGDMVERDAAGNIFYIGRANNCIKRLGKRLCLDSLADKVEQILKQKTVCLWKEDLNKLIVCIHWNKSSFCNRCKNQSLLMDQLSDFELPDAVYYIDNLPLNKHGKLDREQLMQNVITWCKNDPIHTFQNFLRDVLGFDLTIIDSHQKIKRLKLEPRTTFVEAGGTSFQALSLATEIGRHLSRPEDQRNLLAMLLSSKTSLKNIMDFLSSFSNLKTKREEKILNFEVISEYKIKFLWRSDLKKCVDASPTLLQNTKVSVGSHSRLLLTLDGKTGKEISRLELSDRIECPVVFFSPDLAFVGCYDGTLYCFNFTTGHIVWKISVNGMIKAKPLVVGNLVIVSSYAGDFNIHGIDIKTQKCIWKFKLGLKGIFSSPIKVSQSLALFCSLDGTYALLHTFNGDLHWLNKLETPIFSTPAVLTTSENEIVLAEVKGRVTICSITTGKEVTHFQADGNIFSSLTLYRKTCQHELILFGCHDSSVYCLSYTSPGKQLSLFWKCLLNAAIYSTPVILFDRTILACSTKGLIVLIDVFTGQIKSVYDLKSEIFSTPCVNNFKTFYVGSRDNFLYAFEV